ncbi:MAG: putative LPS assembly protein LptD [Candidatus Zixiibacteriota bacterium]
MSQTVSMPILIGLCLFLGLSPSLSSSPVTGPSSEEASREPLQLLNADFSEIRLEKDNEMVNLIGNVVFKQGDLNLKSSRAVWYRTAGQVVFIDSVRIEDKDQTLSADKVTYYKNSRKAVADGHVLLIGKKEQAQVRGEHGEYDRIKKYVQFTGSPSLVLKPDRGDSTVTVAAQFMEYYPDEKKGVAKEKVTITKANMTATCDQATWISQSGDSVNEGEIILEGHPEARKQNDRLAGEHMEIYLQDDRIKRIEVKGDAKASHLETSDSTGQISRESLLAAKNMIFRLKDEKLEQVNATGNATSTYYPQSSNRSDQKEKAERNEASGDTIDLFLANDHINRVLIKGGAMGDYLFTPEKKADSLNLQDTIWYSAQVIDYQIKDSLITLQRQSSLRYGQISLSAGKIFYQTEEEILVAEGMKTQPGGQKEAWEGLPVLKDGKDEIEGERMNYDLRTKRGKVKAGVTGIQGGTYKGRDLRKITDKVLLADGGTYTTCDQTPPHFHFYARKMKIIAQDKVIAQPVVFYIADLPVAAIPYYVFPIKPGRHSGLLTFDVGSLEAGRRFFRNLGYYWAASDFWDLKTALDYYEGSGWLIKSEARYAKRYVLSGNVAGSYNRQSSWNLATFTKTKNDRWDFTFNHQHTISPSLSLAAYGTFLSDKNYWHDLNLNPVERRNSSLYSQANLSKRWQNSSLTLAFDHRWNLDTDDRQVDLPVISFTRPSLPFIAPRKSKKGETAPGLGSSDRRWYNSIYYSLSSSFVNFRDKTSTGTNYNEKEFAVSDNSLSLSAPQNLLGWLVLNPGFHYQETWYYVFNTNLSENLGIPSNTLARRGTYAANLSASTALYGTFNPKIGNLVGIRHVMTPSANLVWQPEFTRKNEYVSYTGRGGSGPKQKSLSFGLGNLLQIKTKSVTDGKEQENKLDLFNLSFSSGYNFLAQAHKLSNLSTSLRSSAVKNLDLAFSVAHDFYDKAGDLKLKSPRWIYFSLDTRMSFRGSWKGSTAGTSQGLKDTSGEGETQDQTMSRSEGLLENITQNWSVDVTHRYSQTRGGSKTHWVDVSLKLPLTRKWLLSYDNRFDFSENKITEQTFEFYRDMHCWEGRFTWIATGYRKGYYFRINIKALPEIKVEKSQGGLREVFF